jgi:PAS domain S-box-containing protein
VTAGSPAAENPDLAAQEIIRLREIIIDLERQIAESRRAGQRLAVRDAVTSALAESSSLEEAAPRIVRTVCEALGWQFGALWTVEPHVDLLRCVEVWHAPSGKLPEFEAATSRRRFSRGVGMPGRVWASAAPAWIPDVTTDENFPRATVAAREGLRACLGFPILVGTHCLGVMEFFSGEIQQPDQELLDMLGALGSQIGQFVERKRAEKELDRYFALSLDMLCIGNYAGYFVRLNPAWERTLGYSIGEMTSTPFIEFVHLEDRAATLFQLERLSKGEDTISFENRYRAKDGSYRWLLWNVTPFAQEQLLYGAARDITERKRAEENIQKLRHEAESANRAKSEFLARMSHEIRTPLNVVIGMGDVLERTALNSEQRQYVRVSQKAGDDLLTLINDLLDLSKAESDRITLEEIDFALSDVTEAVIEIMSMRAQQKRIQLLSEILPATPSRLRGDPDRLRQVLINLVGNAIKFTEKGRVRLSVGPDPGRQTPGALRFSVSDTGIGIPPEKLDSIFEAFAQADASTTRKYGGTGLGLAISRRLVGLMDGRIWAESQAGGGAAFYFTAQFRIAGSDVSARAHTPGESQHSQAATSFPGLRILVVDDSEENRFLVVEYLKDLGCEIESAENGESAFEKFCSGTYGLVLMDLQMPVMDGFAATRRIRGWEKEQGRLPTPILALTASALSGELQHALDAGCDAYVRKPVRLLTLVEAVGKFAAKAASGIAQPGRILVRADARLRAVIPGYLQNRRGDVRAIQEAIERADYDTVCELGHKMNGSGSGYGFPRITEIGRALENAGRERNADLIHSRIAELSAYLDQIDVV